MDEKDGFSLQQLSEETELTPRTIRYYIQQGLLAPPAPAGPNTRYEQRHLERLWLIRQLQQQHLPLAEIRRQLAAMSDEEVRGALGLRAERGAGKRSEGALDYVRAMLGRETEVGEVRGYPMARSQWERLVLAEDVELHVRRPLSREMNRRVQQLVEEARRIFDGS